MIHSLIAVLMLIKAVSYGRPLSIAIAVLFLILALSRMNRRHN